MKLPSEQIIDEMLMPGVRLLRTTELVQVAFERPHRALSCAVLNGGLRDASHFLNVRVAKHCPDPLEDPALTLLRLSEQLQCTGVVVGMMTAASLKSLRVAREILCGEHLAVLVTSGLENARRAGDPAEYRALDTLVPCRGTINMGIVTSVQVAEEALVEMIAIATEAKVAVLQELGITSAISGKLATGTGTDAIAVFSGHGTHGARFAGKHTLFGERLALLVMDAMRRSLDYQTAASTCD